MTFIAIFDLISILGFFASLIIIVEMSQKSFLPHAKAFYITLVVFLLLYSAALFLEWAEITDYFDRLEDVIGALIPMIWAFFFYAFLQNTAAHDLLQSEQVLQETTRNLKTLMTNLPGMAYRSLNEEGWPMVFVSQGCLELTGFEPDDLMQDGKKIYGDLIHTDDRDRIRKEMLKDVEKKQPFELVYRILTTTGKEKWVWDKGVGIFSPVDGLIAIEGFVADVTEQKSAQADQEKEHVALQKTYNELLEKVDETSRIQVEYRKHIDYDKIYVVGDIHGSVDMLKRLMDILPWRKDKDLLIFLGDYIDRGAHGKEVIDYILTLKKDTEYVRCLLGNHDAMFIDYLNGKNINQYIINGGDKTLESYGITDHKEGYELVPEEHVRFLKTLEPYIEVEDYYFVHAGFKPGVKIKEQRLADMLWIRREFIESKYNFGKKVIFGHTPMKKGPLISDNKIGVDTGAVYGETLTCLELPEEKFYSVD